MLEDSNLTSFTESTRDHLTCNGMTGAVALYLHDDPLWTHGP